MLRSALVVVVLVSSAHADTASGALAAIQTPAFIDTRCPQAPAVKATGWRHKRSRWITSTGAHNHRGIDLIASEDDAKQVVAGKLAYGKVDKDIEDEDVEVFACLDSKWQSLGVARTDDDGRFTIELTTRLPVGMRDLYVAALGDGTGSYFVGYVAPRGSGIVVSDVDGTLSWSENSVIKQAIKRSHDIGHRPYAPEALSALPYPIVYTTARGDVFVNLTRSWLERHGFPRGLLRLSHGLVAKPGKSAIAYKTATLKALALPIAAGIGNRKSDIIAYTAAGLDPRRIFIHLPEYEKEVKQDLAAGKAVGVPDYRELPKLLPKPGT